MKNLKNVAIALAVVFYAAAALFAWTLFAARSNAHNHTAASASCCSDASCCSGGSCKMNGACCGNHNKQAVAAQTVTVESEKSSCCDDASCCAGGTCKMGGSCCGSHASEKTQNARFVNSGVTVEDAGGASCHHNKDNTAKVADNGKSSCCGSDASCCPNGACCGKKAVQASL